MLMTCESQATQLSTCVIEGFEMSDYLLKLKFVTIAVHSPCQSSLHKGYLFLLELA